MGSNDSMRRGEGQVGYKSLRPLCYQTFLHYSSQQTVTPKSHIHIKTYLHLHSQATSNTSDTLSSSYNKYRPLCHSPAKNIKMPSNFQLVEPHPSVNHYAHAGRGGAGNYFKAPKTSNGSTARGPASLFEHGLPKSKSKFSSGRCGAATPEDPRGEDEGRSCQVQHRPWRSWQLVYSSPRGISQGLLQLFRQQWQRTKWILRPLEPHPRAPLEHLLLTRYIFLRFSERRSAFHHHHGRHQSSGLVLIPTSFDNDISSSRRNIETSEKSDRRMHHHHHHQHGVHL